MPTPDILSRTRELLERLHEGREGASNELFSYMYMQLRDLAREHMGKERGAHTLQPTALVHEIWIKLGEDGVGRAENRRHFLGIAARAMRAVLVDHARRRRTQKRGEGASSSPLDDALLAWKKDATIDPLLLDELLERLKERDERLAQVVELRFFAGLSLAETAEALALTQRQVEHAWKLARAWLIREFESR